MSDHATLVERLRKFHDEIVASDGAESGQMFMTGEAAARIAELEAERDRLKEVTEIIIRNLRDEITRLKEERAASRRRGRARAAIRARPTP